MGEEENLNTNLPDYRLLKEIENWAAVKEVLARISAAVDKRCMGAVEAYRVRVKECGGSGEYFNFHAANRALRGRRKGRKSASKSIATILNSKSAHDLYKLLESLDDGNSTTR